MLDFDVILNILLTSEVQMSVFTEIIILLNITLSRMKLLLVFNAFFRLTLVTLNVPLHNQVLPTDQWLHL